MLRALLSVYDVKNLSDDCGRLSNAEIVLEGALSAATRELVLAPTIKQWFSNLTAIVISKLVRDTILI